MKANLFRLYTHVTLITKPYILPKTFCNDVFYHSTNKKILNGIHKHLNVIKRRQINDRNVTFMK